MFWNSFIAICNDNNTTPTATVKALGISLGSVTKWKNGAQPNSTTLKKIADYFNVSVEYLKGETEQKEKQPTLSELSEKQKRLIKIIEGMSDDQLDRFEKILAVVETTEL